MRQLMNPTECVGFFAEILMFFNVEKCLNLIYNSANNLIRKILY